MAQNEDTELRDLVIDALEKNGSLAKIRALLRANIFLAFEDECHLKQNEALNKILNIPEGKLCLSIIHEFLDFCNLRNTLFVYKSETRQGKEYEYQSGNIIADKLCVSKSNGSEEPILLSLIKNSLNLSSKNIFIQNDIHSNGKLKKNFGSDENCTYIVHEDSSTTSQSQSDNSSDEKNKLDLRLHLDNSDTDTSSSSKCKSSSEYIPNKNIKIEETNDKINIPEQMINSNQVSAQNNSSYVSNKNPKTYLHDLKVINNSSDSTSYAELKPFNSIDTILLNTTGLPLSSEKEVKQVSPHNSNSTSSKIESLTLNHTTNSNSETTRKGGQQSNKSNNSLKTLLQPEAGDNDATEYSYDFTSPLSERKEISERNRKMQEVLHDNNTNKAEMSTGSPKQNSLSSQSSVSISDVADLMSETSSKKYSLDKNISDKSKLGSHNFNKSPKDSKILSDDSGDFSESPIPSLSNLSLDIHTFEDECHLKQNEALNKILNIPEGKLCLSIIHEFLDFCNLRNTLFVYKSETRQGKEYEYQSGNIIADKLCVSKSNGSEEPILLSLIKNSLNLSSKNIFIQNDIHSNGKLKKNFGSDENCTYIVHEDSSTTSQSQSDNSSDEKNKLDLRLHLDNSDTDTSSSSKCKSSSEYIPNKNIKIEETNDKINIPEQMINSNQVSAQNNSSYVSNKNPKTYLHDLKVINNSSDSTSYAELKPFNSIDTILLNTTGLPLSSEKEVKQVSPHNSNSTSSKIESLTLNHTTNSNSETTRKGGQQSNKSNNSLKTLLQPEAGDNDATEYSYDFTSPLSERKEISERNRKMQEVLHDNNTNKAEMSTGSPKQNSLSSQSSVSISDVADLMSETSSKKYSLDKNISDKSKLGSHNFNKSPKDSKILSDDSGDFSESPIPSLSNLSLDIHSE